MRVSLDWLHDYTKPKATVHEIAERLTMTLTEVEEIRSLKGLDRIKVGEVIDVKRHPNADNLWLTVTAVGRQRYSIVCGADNVRKGEKVAVALPGTELPSGLKIAVRSIRGKKSEGMLCSPRELGVGEDHSGIWLLPADTPTGISLTKALAQTQDSFELDVLANRPDCLGHLGVAREVAAAFGTSLKEPKLKAAGRPKSGIYAVKISDKQACRRFGMARLRGLKNGESPDWLKQRLTAAGLRPINPIVDVTNFVALEYGQPLHAYDTTKLTGTVILVRDSEPEERVKTLDGKDRSIPVGTLVIADRTQVLGLAGIMGGAGTETAEGTEDIILECANFDPARIRRSSRAIGLRTDASARFEKGLPPALAELGLRRAVDLIKQICGGELVQYSDTYPTKQKSVTISLDLDRMNDFLGLTVLATTAKRYLTRLGFAVSGRGTKLRVKPPVWRGDVSLAEDLYEEVVRQHGYHQVPETVPEARLTVPTYPPLHQLTKNLQETLVGAGLTEIITHSLVGKALLKRAGYPTDQLATMANPLSEDHQYLRRSMEPRHLEAVADNLRWRDAVSVFEIGATFKQTAGANKVTERRRLQITLASTNQPAGLDTARGFLTTIGAALGVATDDLHFEPLGQGQYAPGRQFNILVANEVIGHLADYAKPKEWKAGGISLLSLELDRWVTLTPTAWTAEAPPKFPAVSRDLSLFIPDNFLYGDLVKELKAAGETALAAITNPEEFTYRGRRSLTVHLEFRHPERTMKDVEVTEIMARIGRKLKEKGLTVRG